MPSSSGGEDSIDGALASATVGLVSTAAFREKRIALEAAAAEKPAMEEQEERERVGAERARKRARKQKHENEQRRGLSFVETD